MAPFVESPLELKNLPSAPALVLTCLNDATTNSAASSRLADALSDSELEVFADGDHFSLYWDDKYMQRVAAFMGAA